jgi:hypothetical protein
MPPPTFPIRNPKPTAASAAPWLGAMASSSSNSVAGSHGELQQPCGRRAMASSRSQAQVSSMSKSAKLATAHLTSWLAPCRSKVSAHSYSKTQAYPADFPWSRDTVRRATPRRAWQHHYFLGARLTKKSWASLPVATSKRSDEMAT